MSETIEEPKLAGAFVKAQAQIQAAKKDAVNPHFKSTYADLASVIEVVRKPLGDNGLGFSQRVSSAHTGVTVVTRLLHSSGETMDSEPLWLPVAQQTPQAFGSAITYGKRYSLSAMLGVATEDDDGNASSAAGKIPPPAGVEKLRQQVVQPDLSAQLKQSIANEQAKRAFQAPPEEVRVYSEPPPHTDEDAPSFELAADLSTGEVVAPPDAPCPNYGKGKGGPLSALSVGDLEYYKQGCLRTLGDPTKATYHKKEQKLLASLEAWIAFRQ